MTTLNRFGVAWGAMLVVAFGVPSAFGQIRQGMQPLQKPNTLQQQQQQKQAQRQPFQNSGTIVNIGTAGIQMDVGGIKYNVAADKTSCRFEVTGTADASILKPGMYVHFSGDFDKKGKATAPISDLEVGSPPAAATDAPHSGVAHTAAKKPTATAGPATVAGALKSFSNNTMTVDNSGTSMQADLSPTASIKVDVTDPRAARELVHPGDKVDVTGFLVQAPNGVLAEEIKITLSTPQGKPGAKPGDKPTSTSATN